MNFRILIRKRGKKGSLCLNVVLILYFLSFTFAERLRLSSFAELGKGKLRISLLDLNEVLVF